MQGYCVRCKAKQEMLSATRTLTRNGRRAMIGLCACCGTKMSVVGVWDGEAHGASSAATITEEVAHAAPTVLAPSHARVRG